MKLEAHGKILGGGERMATRLARDFLMMLTSPPVGLEWFAPMR
jgi:hypothetical protein